MDISDILISFNTVKGTFPHQAVNAAIEKQTEITPVLLEILKNTVENYKTVAPDRMEYVFALYLLSKFRETAALPYILQFAALSEERLDDLLGDCVTESLARFIVSTFDGNITAIKTLIENEQACEWSRDAALRSLIGLVATQKLTREEVITYLKELFASPFADQIEFTTALVNVACDLYPEELLNEIKRAFEDEKVNDWMIDMEFINDTLEEGKDNCLKDHVFENSSQLPIDDIEKTMSWMTAFHSQYPITQYSNNEYVEARTTPKIGRNELCPCGSEKKYKKCCLE